jgi:ribosomal protein S18 acetylase RimI-like enzyme
MTIRSANEKEMERIRELSPKIADEITNGYLNEEDPQVEIHNKLVFEGDYFVCITDHTLQGWVAFGEIMDPFHLYPVGFIYELYVFPRYRKSGIGKKLLLKAMEVFENKGYSKVQLNVFEGNAAKNLYHSIGFTDISTLMEIKVDEGRG